MRYDMAIAIAPTPVLKGKDIIEFTKKVEQGLKQPVNLIATPKIENARKLIIEYVSKYKK